jgi:hypothetical protein
MSIESEDAPAFVEVVGAGAVDYTEDRAELSADMREFAEVTGLSDPAGWNAEIVYAKDVVFMRIPAITKDLPKGKSWLRIDVGASIAAGSSAYTQPDPQDMLTFLAAAGTEVDVVGEEAIGRFATTRYRARLTSDRLAEQAREDGVDQLVVYADRLGAAGMREFTLDAWIDNDGRARRLQVEHQGIEVEEYTASFMYAFEVIKFDSTIDIALPPKRDVATVEEIARSES